MEEKALKEFGKILVAIIVLIVFLYALPYCRGALSSNNFYVVTDEESAEQIVTFDKKSGIIVEFNCLGNSFPKLLNKFVKKNSNLDLVKIETLYVNDTDQARGFAVTFFKNWWLLQRSLSNSWRFFLF